VASATPKGSHMMIDDDTLKQLLRIDDELMQLCKWLNEMRDIEISSRLIPWTNSLTFCWKRAKTSYTENLLLLDEQKSSDIF
jgi:hypothetical protein